jgi:arylformamidase
VNSHDEAVIDISIPLGPDTVPWPGDTPFHCGWTARREDGASVNLSAITMSPHVGTHADAPLHVDSDWPGSDALPLSAFVGPCVVAHLPSTHDVARDITPEILSALLGDAPPPRVLLRTGHSITQGAFPDDWPALSDDAAAWLLASGVVLFGSDAPSADRRTSTALPIHHHLFHGGAYVLENLALDHVPAGSYFLSAAPLALVGSDAAPVRAFLTRARA